MFELLIYVYADENYEMFVLPYIFFALSTNKTAHVEVALSNVNSSLLCEEHPGRMKLKEIYGDHSFTIRMSKIRSEHHSTPNVRRFIEEPKNKSKYLTAKHLLTFL